MWNLKVPKHEAFLIAYVNNSLILSSTYILLVDSHAEIRIGKLISISTADGFGMHLYNLSTALLENTDYLDVISHLLKWDSRS